jgi:hypothetical protein
MADDVSRRGIEANSKGSGRPALKHAATSVDTAANTCGILPDNLKLISKIAN